MTEAGQMRYLDGRRVADAAELLSRSLEVLAPVLEGANRSRLERWPARGRDLVLGPRKPLLPLKTLFLPEVEELCRFSSGEQASIVTPAALANDRVVLGALGCDLAALAHIDRVFLEQPVDEAYRERRERTTLLALACPGEGPECFCASLGIDPLRPAGADGLLTPAGSGYLLETLTAKGATIVEVLGDLLRRPAPDELSAAAAARSTSRADVSLAGLPLDWSEAWREDSWGELAARCLSCGVCTLLCPTCHCFDVEDQRGGREGTRFRSWDSCMFCQFTRMASGENPRAGREARVRQRFLHKLSYFPERYGALACVGCGRCTRSCPVGIGIEEVISRPRAGGAT